MRIESMLGRLLHVTSRSARRADTAGARTGASFRTFPVTFSRIFGKSVAALELEVATKKIDDGHGNWGRGAKRAPVKGSELLAR